MSRFFCLVVCLAFVGCSNQKYEGTNNKAGDELNKGKGFYDKQDYKTAISCYTEAIRLDPDLALAYSNRGAAYLGLGKNDEVIRDCSEAIKLDPDLAMAYSNRAAAYLYLGKYDEGIRDCSEAIKLNPNLAQAYYNRGFGYNKKGDPEKAKVDFEMAKKLGFPRQ